MMRQKKRLLSVTVCIMMIILQSACARGLPASFCQLYQPVYTSPTDTEETRKQADTNNALWLEMCPL